ncbi:MAG TPA: L-2-amino-thiazoline-4-carboxylic acid hydrolase [Clostridia bacterium]
MTNEEVFIQASKLRAKAYYYLFDEFSKEIGEEKTQEIFKKAIYRLGLDKSESFSSAAGLSAKTFAEEFVKDPIGKNVFKQSILEAQEDKAVVEMKGCPLVDLWKELNLSDEQIAKLCDAAHQIDYGTVEGKGLKLKFPTRLSHGGSSCILEINKK